MWEPSLLAMRKEGLLLADTTLRRDTRALRVLYLLIGLCMIVLFGSLLSAVPAEAGGMWWPTALAMANQQRPHPTAGARARFQQLAAGQVSWPRQANQFVQPIVQPGKAQIDLQSRQSAMIRSRLSASAQEDIRSQGPITEEFTEERPLRVLIAGAGLGGLTLANSLAREPKIQVTVLEKTDKFQRFGGPIQLASNALQVLKEMDESIFKKIMSEFTFTGDKVNGIKDGISGEWFQKLDLAGPADARGQPYTGVIDRPVLQEIYLDALPPGVLQNGDGIARYESLPGQGVKVTMQSGAVIEGDVLIGADGIWSAVRASMHNVPSRGDGSGVAYSGYTVFAGELAYKSFDNGEVGYKVYIGPRQYFVVSDIGKGRYQWYAFLARKPGSADTEPKPDGQVAFLKKVYYGWSTEIADILDATSESEIGQRDLYDLPPSVIKPWATEAVALLGDSVHAMMPNLGQGGCQAIEDALVMSQELKAVRTRSEIASKLQRYSARRLIRSAAVQGLSRLASEAVIYIATLNKPAKITLEGGLKFENFNFYGLLTVFFQPILPIIFSVQYNFLFDGWKNEAAIDVKAALSLLLSASAIMLFTKGGVPAGASIGFESDLQSVFGADDASNLIMKLRDLRHISEVIP